MRMEKIALKNIRVQVDAADWEDAIGAAGCLLVSDGRIDAGYIRAMTDAVRTLGPYMVLMPGFALAHAAPSELVKETGISLVTLHQPVNFGSKNDPVSVVMCLACTDRTSHMAMLQEIAKKLMADGIVEKMRACRTREELYQLIN